MGLTGFNRQRKRALMETVGDPALAEKLMAYGINDPEKLNEASEEDLSFLTEAEIAQCRGEEPEPIEELNVKPLKKKVAETDDVEVLGEWLEAETNNQDRKTAKEAIQARIDELEEAEEPEPEKDDSEAEEPDQTEDTEPETEEESEDEGPVAFEDLPGDTEFPHNYGGSYFYLSDGSKVQGEKAAEKAQQALENSEG